MKKLFVKVSLTVVFPVLLFLVVYEVTMRSIPNDYSYKSELWEQKVSNIKVLILGSSHCYYGFNPAFFSTPSFNAAHVSQSYNYDWFLFDKYFDRMDSLKYVILPISSFSPYSRLENGGEAWHCKDYSIHYHCRFHKWYEIKYRYHFAYISIENLLLALQRIKDNDFNHIHVDNNGYSRKTIDNQIDFAKDGKTASERHTIKDRDKKTDLYAENEELVNDIIQRCEERGIKVILVSTPTMPEYYSLLENEQIKTMEDFGKKLEVHNNVKYINLLKSPLFIKEDFFNSDHLCDNGAKKLSLMINDTLEKWNK